MKVLPVGEADHKDGHHLGTYSPQQSRLMLYNENRLHLMSVLAHVYASMWVRVPYNPGFLHSSAMAVLRLKVPMTLRKHVQLCPCPLHSGRSHSPRESGKVLSWMF